MTEERIRINKTRKFLFENLDNISKSDLWFMVCEDYPLDLETIRQFKDFIDWKILASCDVIDRHIDDEDVLNAMREFKDKLDWEEGGFWKWYEEVKWNERKR